MTETRKIRIRQADAFDVVNMGKLVMEMLDSAKMPLPATNVNRLMAWVIYVTTQELSLVADIDGRIVGTAGFVAKQPPWSTETLMEMGWLYVIPAFRKRGTCDALMRWAETWATERKLRLSGGIINGTFSAQLSERINSHGYHKVGLTFLKDTGDVE